MAETALDDLTTGLRPGARLMGIDLGEKTLGLALSDTSFIVATPLETVRRRKFTPDAEALGALIDAHRVGALVYGLPRNMDGTEGPRCQSTRQFARNFDALRPMPYSFWDERLSTAAVERILIGEADLTRKRRAQVVDRAAAAYILQGAIDALSMKRARAERDQADKEWAERDRSGGDK